MIHKNNNSDSNFIQVLKTEIKENFITQHFQPNLIDKAEYNILLSERTKDFFEEKYKINKHFLTKTLINEFMKEHSTNQSFFCLLKPFQDAFQELNEDNIDNFDLKILNPIFELLNNYIREIFDNDIEIINSNLLELGKILQPDNWYDSIKATQRRITLHTGNLLLKKKAIFEKMITSNNCCYVSSSEILAYDFYDKLTKAGIPCSLLTENENILNNNSQITLTTKSRIDLEKQYECVFIDEVALDDEKAINHYSSQVILGVKSSNIHIVCEDNCVHLIKKITQKTTNQLIRLNYKSNDSYKIEGTNIHSVSQLKDSDCILGFTKEDLFLSRDKINFKYQKKHVRKINKCALILPEISYTAFINQKRNLEMKKSNRSFVLCDYKIFNMGIEMKYQRVIISRSLNGCPLNLNLLKKIVSALCFQDRNISITTFCENDLKFINENILKVNEVNSIDVDSYAKIFPPMKTLWKIKYLLDELSGKIMKFTECIQELNIMFAGKSYFLIKNLGNEKFINELEAISNNFSLLYNFSTINIQLNSYNSTVLKGFYTQLSKKKKVKLPQQFNLENKFLNKDEYNYNDLLKLREILDLVDVYIQLSKKYEKEFIEVELSYILRKRLRNIIDSIIEESSYNVNSDLNKIQESLLMLK